MLSAAAPMAVIWGADFRLLYNDPYGEIIQDKHPSALGQNGARVFPEIWESVFPLFQRAYGGEGVVLDDISLPLKRGDVVREAYFSGSYNPIWNDRGGVDGFLAVIVETTSRIARERQRADTFDTTLSAIADFAYSFDREGRFLYVNKALLDLWGMKLEQAVGKNFFELNYPEALAERLQRQIQDVFEHKKSVRDETPYVSPLGAIGHYEYIFSPVFGPDGSVIVVAGSTREISTRKRLERELRDVQNRMEAALSAGSIGTWEWNVETDEIVADRILAQFFSVSPEESKGRTFARYLEAIHSEDRERVRQKIAELLAHGTAYECEYRVIDVHGGVRWVVARGSLQRDSTGKPVSMPGMVLDITERKLLEQRVQETIRDLTATQLALEKQAGALESLVVERTAKIQETVKELEAFSYSVSHDLRGPLRVMQSFAQALKEDCGDEIGPVAKDYIRRIVAAASRMDRIIQEVLVYSRIARTDLPLERISLDEFMPSLLDGYPSFHDSAAEIVIEGTLPAVLGNSAALTQCVANLIGNATKFVAAGARPHIRISARTENSRVYISIVDNGIGIPKEAHESIFGAFYRLDSRYEGTGIGLSIVRKAVERMGGQITVESQVDRGSTFTFDLALAP